jgi:hypothetical protein
VCMYMYMHVCVVCACWEVVLQEMAEVCVHVHVCLCVYMRVCVAQTCSAAVAETCMCVGMCVYMYVYVYRPNVISTRRKRAYMP